MKTQQLLFFLVNVTKKIHFLTHLMQKDSLAMLHTGPLNSCHTLSCTSSVVLELFLWITRSLNHCSFFQDAHAEHQGHHRQHPLRDVSRPPFKWVQRPFHLTTAGAPCRSAKGQRSARGAAQQPAAQRSGCTAWSPVPRDVGSPVGRKKNLWYQNIVRHKSYTFSSALFTRTRSQVHIVLRALFFCLPGRTFFYLLGSSILFRFSLIKALFK